jgi:chloride channel protein, CIC family
MREKSFSDSSKESIPISVSMEPLVEEEDIARRHTIRLTRLLYICLLAVLNALLVSIIAKVMVWLINLVTGLSFYGTITQEEVSPVGTIWVCGLFLFLLSVD